jgi:hypothetical protein
MTRRELSDAQLDAEAAGGPVKCPRCRLLMLPEFPHNHETPPRPEYDPMPTRPPDLLGRIAVIRREYLAEIPVRLHVAYVPSRVEPIELDGWEDGPVIEVTDSGPLGSPSWSPPFHRFIGDEFGDGPWHHTLKGLRRWCAGKHQTWYEHQTLPLCWTLARAVVLGGYSIGRAAELSGVSPETADALLTTAVDKWWAWTSNQQNGIDLRPRRPAA